MTHDLSKTIMKARDTADRRGESMDVLNLNRVGAAMYVIRAENPRHRVGPYSHQWVTTVHPTGHISDMRQAFESSDDGDDWGNTMMWLFAVCDFVTFELGLEVPAEFAFSPSPCGADTDNSAFQWLKDARAETHIESGVFEDMVLEFAEELRTHADDLRRLGKDY